MCEVVHQDIVNSLLSQKLELKKNMILLISNLFKREGRNINLKFNHKGKYIIPGTINGEGMVYDIQ